MLVAVALYTAGLVALVGDDGDPRSAQPPAAGPGAVAAPDNEAERAVAAAFRDLAAPGKEQGDRAALRTPRLRSARCDGSSCVVLFTLGVPGEGVVIGHVRTLLERILRTSDVSKLDLEIRRFKSLRAPGDPSPAEDETPQNAPLAVVKCRRSRAPDLDVRTASGGTMLRKMCDVTLQKGGGRSPG